MYINSIQRTCILLSTTYMYINSIQHTCILTVFNVHDFQPRNDLINQVKSLGLFPRISLVLIFLQYTTYMYSYSIKVHYESFLFSCVWEKPGNKASSFHVLSMQLCSKFSEIHNIVFCLQGNSLKHEWSYNVPHMSWRLMYMWHRCVTLHAVHGITDLQKFQTQL